MKRFLQNLKMIDISIIIVSFNTKNLTVQCIKSVFKEGSKLEKEIIVVDNGSVDDSVKEIEKLKIKNRKLGSKIKIIVNSENLGFSKANNIGIKEAKGKYILLLNSDTVVKKGSIEALLEFARKKKDAGAVVPKLINPDGTTQASVFRLPNIKRAIEQYWLGKEKLLDKYYPEGNTPSIVESAVMAAFLITPKTLKMVGLLDERYFIYFEDLDYSRRIQEKGLKIYYLPSAEVIHYHGASGKNLIDERNQWRRLIPSSKIYHGTLRHYLFNFILWSGQKWRNFFKNQN